MRSIAGEAEERTTMADPRLGDVETQPGPLAGVRVLEFSQIVAAPVCGVNLSDLGADVIKVEPPGGESTRNMGAVMAKEGKGYQALNRGKRSLIVDLQSEEGRSAIHRLIPTIDVVLINYRLGVPERIDIDYDTLRALRPDLIYWQNTGFGEEGPEAYRAGSDIVAQAYSGLMALDGKLRDDGAPDLVSSPVADIMTGFAAAMGVCAALYHRAQTGQGQRLSTSLLRSALFMMAGSVMREPVHDAVVRDQMMARVDEIKANGGSYDEIIAARDSLQTLRVAFRLYYGGYRAKDGGVVLGALTKANRDGMRQVLGIYGEEDSDREGYDAYDDENQRVALEWRQRIREIFLTKTVDEWVRLFDEAGVPVAPVQFPEEMADDPQVWADQMTWELEHSVTGPQRVMGPAVAMSVTPTRAYRPAPAYGEHSSEVLVEAGLSVDEVAELCASGVVHAREMEAVPS
jgi:crotonobetainyl-CoA:carnitine CoA-transferase CaiB-like acyl-CoA transferase